MRLRRNRALRGVSLLTLTFLLLAGALVAAPAAGANGKGVTVYLGYLPEVSNWGPFEAGGEAYVNGGEGRAHITVDHLPADAALHYEVWLVPVEDRETYFSIGTFAVDAAGHADVELVSADLVPGEYRFLIVTAEPEPDPDPAPDARRAIAGVFPNDKARTPSAGLTAIDDLWTQPGEGAAPAPGAAGTNDASGATSPAPPRLPVTGRHAATPLVKALTIAAGLASVGLMVAGERRRRLAGAERAQGTVEKGKEQ